MLTSPEDGKKRRWWYRWGETLVDTVRGGDRRREGEERLVMHDGALAAGVAGTTGAISLRARETTEPKSAAGSRRPSREPFVPRTVSRRVTPRRVASSRVAPLSLLVRARGILDLFFVVHIWTFGARCHTYMTTFIPSYKT